MKELPTNMKKNLAQQFLLTYNPEDTNEIIETVKDFIGSCIESIMEGELTEHLGYESNWDEAKSSANRRNDSTKKPLDLL